VRSCCGWEVSLRVSFRVVGRSKGLCVLQVCGQELCVLQGGGKEQTRGIKCKHAPLAACLSHPFHVCHSTGQSTQTPQRQKDYVQRRRTIERRESTERFGRRHKCFAATSERAEGCRPTKKVRFAPMRKNRGCQAPTQSGRMLKGRKMI